MSKELISTVTFVDDVPRGRMRIYNWEKITSDLRANPGKWAIISSEEAKGTRAAAQRTAANIRRGMIRGISRGEFEATTRESVVYARYKGETGGS